MLYAFVAIALLKMTFKCVNRYARRQEYDVKSIFVLKSDVVRSLVAVSTILSFVFIFPTYGNAKYYVFMLPFIFSLSLNVYSKNTIIKFVLFLNFILMSFLIMYYF